MKIVNPATAASQKSGVVGPTNPFKRAMGGASEPKETVPVAKPLSPPSTYRRKLPGGVEPKTMASSPPATLKPATAAASTREAARAHANVKAENLVELRQHAVKQSTQRYDTRLVDLICQELKIELGNGEQPARPQTQAANSDRFELRSVPAEPAAKQAVATVTPISAAAAAQREAEVKAASAVQLIEKIEAFVKSQRPGLAIALDGSLGARVEIERLGPKEVAIRVVGTNGPPAPEDIGRIREEMRARGLKVGALSVA